MRIIISLIYLVIVTSCGKKEVNYYEKVYRHHSLNDFSKWQYEYTDTLEQSNRISTLKELRLNILDSVESNGELYYKYHYVSPFHSDVEGILFTKGKDEIILSWNLSHASIHEDADLDWIKKIVSDKKIFNSNYVPPPPKQ